MAPIIPKRDGPNCFIVSTRLLTDSAFHPSFQQDPKEDRGAGDDPQVSSNIDAKFMPVTREKDGLRTAPQITSRTL